MVTVLTIALACSKVNRACTASVILKWTSNCVAEAKDDRRGDVARIYFLYARDQYGLQISRQQNQLFTAWSKLDPPDAWECERNRRISRLQGQGNPHVQACPAPERFVTLWPAPRRL